MNEIRSALPGPLLVTGGHGFIGRRVVALAQARGIRVLAPPRSALDCTDAGSISRFMVGNAPVAVIHLASPGVFASDPNDPALIDNETGMMQGLLDTAPYGCRIVGGGSMAEYGQSGRLDEAMLCTPRNAYARAKYEAGRLLVERLESGIITGCHARIFGAYGSGEAPRRLLPMVIDRLRQGQPVALSDCLHLRDFIHVDDVADALISLATVPGPLNPVINIGTGVAVSVRAVVEKVADELGASRELLHFGAVARSPHDQDELEAQISRLQAVVGRIPVQHFAQSAPVLPLIKPLQC